MKLFKLQDRLMAMANRRKRRPGRPQGVLLVSGGGIGDTVLLAYVISSFAKLATDNEPVTLLLNGAAGKMAFLCPDNINVRSIDFQRLRKDLKFRRQVMGELFESNYRKVIHLDHLRHPDMDEALVFACDAHETIAMEPRPWAKYDTALQANRDRYDRLFDSGPARFDKVQRWQAFAGWLRGAALPDAPLALAEDLLPPPAGESAPLVVIQPYSAVKQKQCTPGLIRAIIAALPEDHVVAVAGAPSDRDLSPEYEHLFDDDRVSFEGASFQALTPRLRAARLVVSVDTACMHLAVAAGAPTLCLASAAYVGEIVPYAPELTPPNAHFIYQPMECEGCLGVCHKAPVDGMFPCVAALDENAIIDKVTALLQSPSSSSIGH